MYRGGLISWLKDHDDTWWFSTSYIVLALVLSIWISIFWLVALVGLHAIIEWQSLKVRGVDEHLAKHVAWHLKLDIVLVVFALWLGVYLDAMLGVLGLGHAARVGAQAGSRALALQQTIRGVAMSADDAALAAKAIWEKTKGKKPSSDDHVESETPWNERWALADRIIVGAGILFVLTILAAPWIISITPYEVVTSLMQDLHPWP